MRCTVRTPEYISYGFWNSVESSTATDLKLHLQRKLTQLPATAVTPSMATLAAFVDL